MEKADAYDDLSGDLGCDQLHPGVYDFSPASAGGVYAGEFYGKSYDRIPAGRTGLCVCRPGCVFMAVCDALCV